MAETVIYPKLRTSRRLPDGTVEDIYYQVTVESNALDTMARRAAANKGWKAAAGPIRIKVLATHKAG